MTQYLNPYSGRQFVDANGAPYSGAKLFTYVAGSSTKATTTKDSAGTSNHTNPIVLNSKGEPADAGGAACAIWQTGGGALKLVLAPSTDSDPPVSPIATWDNLSGINDSSTTANSEWVTGPTPTYSSATSFTLTGDQTSTFHVGRRVKTVNSGGTVYSTITANAYTTVTTVTVANDSGSLDSGLSSVYYGLLSSVNTSVPGTLQQPITNTSTTPALFTAGIGPGYVQNIGLSASVATKALTVALKTKALSDPTSASPVQIAFRNATATTGDYVVRSATAAMSVVAPSGATLGFSAAEAGVIYVYAIDNAGTVELAISKKAIFDESTIQNTTAINTASDSDNVLYSTTARTGVAVRLVGRVAITTGAVAGEWDNAPSRLDVWESTISKSNIIIADGAAAVASIGVPQLTFASPVNVNVGDIVRATLTLSCTRNGSDFYGSGSVNLITATAAVESTGLTDTMLAYGVLGVTIHGTQRINHTFAGEYKVITAGTITLVGCNNFTIVGTVPTNQKSYLRVQIIRPNL